MSVDLIFNAQTIDAPAGATLFDYAEKLDIRVPTSCQKQEDGMRMIRDDKDMQGVHMSVGLSNFAWGTPKDVRHELERTYLALAHPFGLDFALANPAKNPQPLDESDPLVDKLRNVLEQGRPKDGETQEEAGFRQAGCVLDLMPKVE